MSPYTGSEPLICPECGEEFSGVSAPMRRGNHRKIAHPAEWAADRGQPRSHKKQTPQTNTASPAAPGPGQASFDDLEAGEGAPSRPGMEETAPRKPGRVQRLRARFGRHPGGVEVITSRERAPRAARGRPRRRVPLDGDVSDLWGIAGRRLERGPNYATGRMLQYQAPAAGVILDTAVAGTLPDRVLFQPLARNRDRYEDVGFLLAGPLLTFTISTTIGQMQAAAEAGEQEVYADLTAKLVMQREMFAWVLSAMLPRLARGAKLAADKKAKRDAAIAEAFPELGVDGDPVEALMAMLFQPPTFEEAAHNGKPDRDPSDADHESAVQFRE